MSKKFIDIDNLQVVWDEINDKFARTKDLESRTANLSISYYDIAMNNSIININESQYNEFIEFINSEKYKKVINDNICLPIISEISYKDNPSNIYPYNGFLVASSQDMGELIYIVYVLKENNEYNIHIQPYGDYISLADFNNLNSKVDGLGQTIITNNDTLTKSINSLNDKVNENLNDLKGDIENLSEKNHKINNQVISLTNADKKTSVLIKELQTSIQELQQANNSLNTYINSLEYRIRVLEGNTPIEPPTEQENYVYKFYVTDETIEDKLSGVSQYIDLKNSNTEVHYGRLPQDSNIFVGYWITEEDYTVINVEINSQLANGKLIELAFIYDDGTGKTNNPAFGEIEIDSSIQNNNYDFIPLELGYYNELYTATISFIDQATGQSISNTMDIDQVTLDGKIYDGNTGAANSPIYIKQEGAGIMVLGVKTNSEMVIRFKTYINNQWVYSESPVITSIQNNVGCAVDMGTITLNDDIIVDDGVD